MPEMLELLLVEDDPAIVSTLSDFLQQEGFSITAASGQRQATALLETRRFHLALLDVTLRDGSGFALCTAIKAQYRIPVIFLTALADENSTVTGLELGGRRLHCKAFSSPGAGQPDSQRASPVRFRYGSPASGPHPGRSRPGRRHQRRRRPPLIPSGIPAVAAVPEQSRRGTQPEPDSG